MKKNIIIFVISYLLIGAAFVGGINLERRNRESILEGQRSVIHLQGFYGALEKFNDDYHDLKIAKCKLILLKK